MVRLLLTGQGIDINIKNEILYNNFDEVLFKLE